MPRSRRGPASYTQASGAGDRKRRQRSERVAASDDLTLLRTAGVVVIAVKLALVPVVMDPLGEDAFGVVKSAVSRGSLYLLLCLAALYLASSPEARDRLRRPRAITLLCVVFAGVSTIATLLAVDQRTALFGAHHRYLGLTSTLDGVGLALGFAVFVRVFRDLAIVSAGLFIGAFVVVAYALVQFAHLDPFSWQDPTVSSTIGNRGFLAGYLVVVAAGAALVAGLQLTESRLRVALGVLAVASAVLVVASGARGPVLALPASGLVTTIFVVRSRPDVVAGWGRRRIAFAAAAFMIASSALFVAVAPRLGSLLAGTDTSLTERALIYESGLSIIRSRPIFGAGPDHFAVLYPTVRPPVSAAVSTIIAPGQTSAHSWFLHHAIATGLAGVVVLLALVGGCFLRAWRSASTAGARPSTLGAVLLGAFLLQGAFNASSVVTELMFWLAIGLCAVGPLEEDAPTRRRADQGLLLRVVLPLGLGLVLAATTANWVLANRDVHASDLFRLAGKRDAAERAALSATQRDGGRANNWNVLGLARDGRPDAALPAFARAVETAPYEPVYLLNLARQEALLSQRQPQRAEAAREHARRAAELDPNGPRTLLVLSQILASTGDPAGAIEPAERAISLLPSADNYDWASLVYAELGRPADAIARLRAKQAILFADGKLPLEERKRLAELYKASGDTGSARSLFAPPSATGADSNCQPGFGSVRLNASVVRPRCLRLVFLIEAPLLAEGTKPGSALDPGAYAIGDGPLPRGSTLSYDGGRFVMLQLPADALPPGPGERIVVRGITDLYGNAIHPDPGHLTVQ